MSGGYILSIDQSTSGTKAFLYDAQAKLLTQAACPHRQHVSPQGWVSHDLDEIWAGTLTAVSGVLEKSGIDPGAIRSVGISNQRETAAAWDSQTGRPLCRAVVWQCARAKEICAALDTPAFREDFHIRTGLRLSPYFSAPKYAWCLQNVQAVKEAASKGCLRFGTVDSWLLWKMTGGKVYATDYSNASRTGLLNLRMLQWDETCLAAFGLRPEWLPSFQDSDAEFGRTDFDGLLPKAVPIRAVMGDSHSSLFAHGCRARGQTKVTYGTGSSIMMNTEDDCVFSSAGLVTSIAWRMSGRTHYVLEGNINYTGAVMRWLEEKTALLSSSREAEQLAAQADPGDRTYFVPAFTGLGCPHWDENAQAVFTGMTWNTGKAELIRAAEESIAYQIGDVITQLCRDVGGIETVSVDGGAVADSWLMQFQSDILGLSLAVAENPELSGAGAAYAAGLSQGLYTEERLIPRFSAVYAPLMPPQRRQQKLDGWKRAVRAAMAQ